jgi:signal transduction histidine kinase
MGYFGLFALVVIRAIAGPESSRALSLGLGVCALAIVPLLYVAFFPPAWLRRVWRQSEEDEFRHALHDLLLYSPDRVTLAQRALGWAARLTGGDAAFVLDADGSVLAARGMSDEDARRLATTNGVAANGNGAGKPWRSGPMVRLPLEMREGHGAMVIISGRLTPLFGDDEMSRLSEYSSSISAGLDRVTLTNRIQVLERAKSDFLNVASHELRGPMTVIKGYLTMLDGGALGEISQRAQSVLPLLISKSDEVNWMLEQMVEASRLEEGRLALKKRRSDLVELAGAAVDGVKMLMSGHEVMVGRPARAIEAEVDPDRFQMVIRNLLSNAAKYSPSGTEIAVRISRDEKTCTVAVTDHGAGISPEDQAGLFTRFNRVASTQHVAGTGLGLWLSREIARMHSGDVTVDSQVGRGSTFSFTVPLHQPA